MADQRNGGIAWTDETWNPLRGCSRISEGCRNCYAETMAARFCGTGQPYEGTINDWSGWEFLDWLVTEGESGANARPMHPDWPRSDRDWCKSAGVPFLFKQWGEFADLTDDKEGRGRARGDYIFTSNGYVLGAGYKSKYGCGGMVEENWREKGGAWMGMVGKKAAGRLLDGVLHDEYPGLRP